MLQIICFPVRRVAALRKRPEEAPAEEAPEEAPRSREATPHYEILFIEKRDIQIWMLRK